MARGFDQPTGHLALLALLWAITCLPNLGGPSLWDIDEGNNFECVREMIQANNWVVPTFNYTLRTDKPALLYWLQIGASQLVGLNEWAARLPSAFAALLTLISVYLLGMRMFSPRVGLLAGLILITSPGMVAAGHFANPDALLLACTTATLALFWDDYARGGKGWLFGVGICAGLGVLAKGPIGFLMPAGVAFVFLLLRGEWRRLLDSRILGLMLAVLLVAAPWYGWVTAETRGVWLREFLTVHNLHRATSPMENHSGPFFYYLVVLFPGLMPWSIFLAPVAWLAWKDRREPATLFLMLWAGLVLVVFSIAQTKLPNYILPAYPALALLMGCYLERWLNAEVTVPHWLERVGLVSLGLAGVAVLGAMLVLGGIFPLALVRSRVIEGLAPWGILGLLLTGMAAVASWYYDRGRRDKVLGTLAAGGALFLLGISVGVLPQIERAKATQSLARVLPADLPQQDAHILAWEYFQPSLVFYCQREVKRISQVEGLLSYLHSSKPAYAFLPERSLAVLERRSTAYQVLGKHKDLYSGRTVVLITNQGIAEGGPYRN